MSTISHALTEAKAGNVSRKPWKAPIGSERKPEYCTMVDVSAPPAERLGYPIFDPDGKLNANGVSSALGRAQKDAPDLVAHLSRIRDAIKANGGDEEEKTEMSRIHLSRKPALARCPGPNCMSHDIERTSKEGEGPMDRCKHCGRKFPHKPGTITAMQIADGDPDDEDDTSASGVNMADTEPDPENSTPAMPKGMPMMMSRATDCADVAHDCSAKANMMSSGAMRMGTKSAHLDAMEAHTKAMEAHEKAGEEGPGDDQPYHKSAARMHGRHAEMHKKMAEEMK
jgi:hypothetical protein